MSSGAARNACDFDYLVSVSRATDREEFELYPIRLENRLPRIKIPLAGRDPDVVVDLQPQIDRCNDGGRYADTIDYSRPPVPPLDEKRTGWTATLQARVPRGS